MSRLATSCAAILVTAAVTVGTPGIGAARAETPAAQSCTPYTAILAPGTWETRSDADPTVPVGLLRPIGDGLQRQFGDDITVLYANYAASAFDQGLTYAQSLGTLESRLRQMVSGLCATTRVLLAGYSQGADGVGDFATEIGNGEGPISPDRVVGVGLVADPHRDPKTTLSLGTPQPGHGIAGTRGQDFGALADRVRTVCADGDLYCSLNASMSPFLAALGQVVIGNPAAIAAIIPPGTDPTTLLAQAVKVGAGWAATSANFPTVLSGISGLQSLVESGNITAAHQIATDVNVALAPIVQAAAGVDLPLVAEVIRAAAGVDPSGWTAAASVLADALTQIDVLHIADVAGHVQETLWRTIELINRGDKVGAGAELVSLTSAGLDLAGAVVGPFTTAIRRDIRAATQTLLSFGNPDSLNDLLELTRQGVDMATFYASKAHVDYGDDTQLLLNFLGSQAAS
ncbi:cutinase family protein [Nocardia tengchongensis]|uniref:cutinase family protein n=1 Tax=Nocardia tengchongensis TaxID=2055889 RepID=UPI0036684D3F